MGETESNKIDAEPEDLRTPENEAASQIFKHEARVTRQRLEKHFGIGVSVKNLTRLKILFRQFDVVVYFAVKSHQTFVIF